METPIWNGVVYRGKIKHAVTCRQFGPLPPMLACRPFRTNCVGRVCREESRMKGWKGVGWSTQLDVLRCRPGV